MYSSERAQKKTITSEGSSSRISSRYRVRKNQKRSKDAAGKGLIDALNRIVNPTIQPDIQYGTWPNKWKAPHDFHHINIFDQKIQVQSNTPAEDSMFYIMSTSGRKPSGGFWDPNERSRRQSLWLDILLREAQKWVDPVIYMGDRKELEGLRGKVFMDAIRHRVHKVYPPVGTWVNEGRDDIWKSSDRALNDGAYKAWVYNNKEEWAKRSAGKLKKKHGRKRPRQDNLKMRTIKCSSLHWSSTPDTQPVAANLGAQPCFQPPKPVLGKDKRNCFWWKRPNTSREPFSEKTSENRIEPAESMDIDTMDVTGSKVLKIEQETLSDDNSMYFDALESIPTLT
ncbi:uncharacterized protein TRUGW13939_05572 [Talaromyces rugulosus]|uniref:Uncharacterized protein n=1 Tax=Talaromyces rugulosus TaxID=121627 RepID=A0A7H8QXQ1_TALRU|nr:uncharacterized protein TRUGW13939_05572 [Talaromyces rugulosus]QKX58448.1 hypothetical protein TRUGW13939_05572 [Talaromyces rugulosus]